MAKAPDKVLDPVACDSVYPAAQPGVHRGYRSFGSGCGRFGRNKRGDQLGTYRLSGPLHGDV
jgi:hypothetical protein